MTIKQIIDKHGGTTAFTNAVNARLKVIGTTIRISKRTVEGWSQGTSKPSAYWVAILGDWMDIKEMT